MQQKLLQKDQSKKTAEETDDLISNQIVNKLIKVSNTANEKDAKNTELNKEILENVCISPGNY